MLVKCVHAALADKSHEMHRALRLLGSTACIDEGLGSEEAAVGNCPVDPHEVLHHDASSAQVQVANFAVADLMLRQSNRQTRSGKQRSRVSRRQRIPNRGLRQRDGIAFLFRAVAPPIKNDQNYRPPALLGHRIFFCVLAERRGPRRSGRCSVGGKSSSLPAET